MLEKLNMERMRILSYMVGYELLVLVGGSMLLQLVPRGMAFLRRRHDELKIEVGNKSIAQVSIINCEAQSVRCNFALRLELPKTSNCFHRSYFPQSNLSFHHLNLGKDN